MSFGSTCTVAALTLGCKVNAYDTEAMLELFLEKGYKVVDFHDFADIYIVNTCTVTNLGDKKSRQMLRRARAKNPEAVIVAAGCYAQVSPEEVSKIKEINLVVGTKERSQIVSLVESCKKENGVTNTVTDIMKETEFEALSVKNLKDRTRAFLKIQEGCDQYCAYCIIPFARGPVRSRQPQAVLEEVKILAANGFKEIVLAGIHVASYGKDLVDTNLLQLLTAAHEVSGIERIRFSSIDPNIVTEEFVSVIKKLPKICDHFHLSLQSGCDKTLKAMNRKYTTLDYERAVTLLRRAYQNAAITTDVIVGFPGETEEDFRASYEFAKKMELAKLHVFPYSLKKGTKAATLPQQIQTEVKNSRSKQMIALGEEMTIAFIDIHVGKEVKVLYEKSVDGHVYEGHTTNYITVYSKSHQNLANKIIDVKILRREKFGAVTEI